MFNFDVVMRQVESTYKKLSNHMNMSFSLEEVKKVFKLFYAYHERYCRYPHPYLRNSSIEWVIENIGSDDNGMEYSIDDYELMIPLYFRAKFFNCDYSIIHFMSGDIRLLRLYEAPYAYIDDFINVD